MKITLHTIKNCSLCSKAMKLLRHWNIRYIYILDIPADDRPYPYITIELEYEELVNMIAKGVLK